MSTVEQERRWLELWREAEDAEHGDGCETVLHFARSVAAAPVVQVVEPLTTADVAEAFNRAFTGSNATTLAFSAFLGGAKFAQRACARKWGLSLKEPRE